MGFSVEQILSGGFDSNFTYLISAENGESAVADPCGDVSALRTLCRSRTGLKPRYILLTHEHPDHRDALEEVRQFFPGKLCAAASARKVHPEIPLKDGDRLALGEGFVECLATPGHSSDSFCYLLSDRSGIFTGDTLFAGCIGFCRPKSMFSSLRRLAALPEDLKVYPGHDYGERPVTTIGEEKRNNVYFRADSIKRLTAELRNLV